MKHLIFFFLLVTNISFANDLSKEVEQFSFQILSDSLDSTVTKGNTLLDITIANPYGITDFNLRYGIDGIEDTIYIDSTSFSLEIPSGKHRLDFYINEQYYEISTQVIDFKPGHRIVATIRFLRALEQMTLKKPIIYLYPEEEQTVKVNLKTKGDLIFTYPAYNNGWEVTATPKGTISSDDKSYNYLFWESNQSTDLSFLPLKEGFIIEGDSVVSFLEDQLTIFGFTAKEQSDFITYWAPSMRKHSNLYICFMFNDACSVFATLNITPKPDELARFYMLWKPVVENGSNTQLTPQRIPTMSRKGFTVLEWGGAKLTSD